MSLYVRVKRANQTIFLNSEPTDTVHDLKTKLSGITKVAPDSLRLVFNSNTLDESKSLNDLKIENDNVLYLVYKKEGTNEFEEVQKAEEVKKDTDE